MGMVEQLMSLLHCEHAPYHEHVMRIIVNLAREHAPSLAECRRPELSFNEFLLQHVIDLRDKPEFQVQSVSESLSLFPLLCVYHDIRLHVARLYTSSADSPFSLISSLALSNHLLLGLPIFLLPCTFISITLHPTQCSSHLITCPYQFNLCSWTCFAISPTFLSQSYLVQLRNSKHPS